MSQSYSQSQGSSSRQEVALKLLNVQKTFNGVLETLERIEALEGHQRATPLERSQQGDINHRELDTNLLALDLKLKCMNGILDHYNNPHYRNECFRNLTIWCERSSKSERIMNLSNEVRNALLGRHELKTGLEPITEKDMADPLSGLAKGTRDYQDQIMKVEEDPEGYIQSDQMYKIREPNPTPSVRPNPPLNHVGGSDIQSNQGGYPAQNHGETGQSQREERKSKKGRSSKKP